MSFFDKFGSAPASGCPPECLSSIGCPFPPMSNRVWMNPSLQQNLPPYGNGHHQSECLSPLDVPSGWWNKSEVGLRHRRHLHATQLSFFWIRIKGCNWQLWSIIKDLHSAFFGFNYEAFTI